VIYLLRPYQGYGSGTSQSEEANKVKDPVVEMVDYIIS
jgi:hypothetical protein